MGRPVPIRAGVGASSPLKGKFLTAKLSFNEAMQGAFRSPPCTPFGSSPKASERPIGLQALLPRRSRRVNPPQREISYGKVVSCHAGRGLSARPLHPFGESACQWGSGVGVCTCGRTGGFPRGKQSARPALPCAPLVVCLNSGSLTAFGGCAHWARASLRSPLHPFGESACQWGSGVGVCACGRTKGLSSG